MHEILHRKRSVFRTAGVFTVLVSVASVGASIGLYFEAPPDWRIWGALFGGVCWLPFIGLGSWGILMYGECSTAGTKVGRNSLRYDQAGLSTADRAVNAKPREPGENEKK